MNEISAPVAALATARCWNCGGEIAAADNYCRHCGKGQNAHIPFYYTQLGIIIMTLAALGPFSLYFVWRSPRLSSAGKWINTAWIAAFTLFVFNSLYKMWTAVNAALSGSF